MSDIPKSSDQEGKRTSGAALILAIVNSVLIVVLGIVVVSDDFTISNLHAPNGSVDLTSKSFQDVGDGFDVRFSSVNAHLSGVELKGRVLNASAVSESKVSFLLKIGGASQTINFVQIDSGYAASFDVYVPNVDPTSTTGTMRFQNAVISYSEQD